MTLSQGKNSRHGNGLPVLEFIFIICATIFYINFEIQAQFILIAPIVAFGYIFYCFIKEKRYQRAILRLLILIGVLILLYLVLTDSTSIEPNASYRSVKIFYSKFSQWILVFFPLFLFYRTLTNATRNQILIILGIGLLNALLLVRAALKIIEIDATILHSMNAERLEDANVNIQGFNFVYAFTFLTLTCYIILKNSTVRWIRYGMLFLLLYSVYFMFASQFALCLVTTFCSFIYFTYKSSGNNSQRKLFSIFLIISVVLLLPAFLKLIISISDKDVLNIRLQEIYDTLTGNGSTNSEESDMYARLELYWKSIMAFFSSPIWGNRSLDFDPHATFWAILADLGLLGAWVVYKLFSKSFNFMETTLGKLFPYYKPLICQILLMGFTNPIHSSPSNYIMLWFICPLLMVLFIKTERAQICY